MFNEFLLIVHVTMVMSIIVAASTVSSSLLLAVTCLQLLLANIFVTKQIVLCGLHSTSSEVFIVTGMYGFSLLQYYTGSQNARRAVWYSFGCGALTFLLMHLLTTFYTPTDHGLTQAFHELFSVTPRIMAASLCAYVVSERLQLCFYNQLAPFLAYRPQLHRFCSIWLGQCVDTMLFATMGLYGIVYSLSQVMLVSMSIKTIVMLSASSLLSFTTQFISAQRHKEKKTDDVSS